MQLQKIETKIIIFLFPIVFSISLAAQIAPAKIPSKLRDVAVIYPKYLQRDVLPEHNVNPVVNSKSVLDDIIGTSRYDNQCNGSMPNRTYLWPDGTISVAWMQGFLDGSGYPDRGTGYNYFNGSTWLASPASGIENNVRTGWPSLNPWMGSGEIIFAHNSSASLVMNCRPAKGTGMWTQSLAPVAPAGVTTLLWPSVVTSGNNHQNIHILAIGQPNYQGMSDALLYFRSIDGGVTWDKQGIILPGMTIDQGLGYSGDDYSWASPKGDTLAFVVAGNWEDGFIMKSFDNGNTWTKTVFYNNPYKLAPVTTVITPFWTFDGSTAIELDHLGKAHIAAGRMRANCDGTARYYYPGTDGLIYWNETMPPIDTTRLSNMDSLYEHNQLAGYVAENGAGDSIVGFPYYGVGMTSHPQITIDNYKNIIVLWSAVTVGNPSPEQLNYRHKWMVVRCHGYTSFSNMYDIDETVIYLFQEYAFPSMAKRIKYNRLQVVSQTSPEPGSNIQTTGTTYVVPVHDVNLEYRELDYSFIFCTVGNGELNEKSETSVGQPFPNPAQSTEYIDLFLKDQDVAFIEIFNLSGDKVIVQNTGRMAPGPHRLQLDCSALNDGFYIMTLKTGQQTFTRKFVVKNLK